MRNKLTPACSDLQEKTPFEMTVLLQEWLADTIDLMMQARQAHRKVKSHHFHALHVLFDKIYADAGKCVDLIVGGLAQFGGIAQNALEVTAPEFGPQEIDRGRKHVAQQSSAIAFYEDLMRRAVQDATQRGDTRILTGVPLKYDMPLRFGRPHNPSEN